MKIVEIIPELNRRGGAEVFCASLSKELAKQNDVVLLSLYNNISDDFREDLIRSGVNICSCDKTQRNRLKSAKKFKQLIEIINPDVLHLHLNCILTYFLAYGFKKPKFKVFLTIHSLFTKDFGKAELIILKQLVKKRIVKLVGISKLISDDIKNSGCEVVKTIYNGASLFEPKHYLREDEITIINVAGFRPVKNHDLLVAAFDECYKLNPNLKLLLVGDGDELERIKQVVSTLSCKDNVTFAGSTNHVDSFLEKADIFCLSSTYEGNPISIIEALSVGLPIVAPNVGGIPDVVKDQENGILFEVGNKEQLVYAIMKLAQNYEICAQISSKNVETAKKYSIANCAKEYLELFENN